MRRFFSGIIRELRAELLPQILVFGSNLAGRHGAGAALQAQLHFGAQPGVGEGPTGRCYALPTKDLEIQTRPLADIAASVERFLEHAALHPEREFLVTAVGCGLAGLHARDIAPMFRGATFNCVFTDQFKGLIDAD